MIKNNQMRSKQKTHNHKRNKSNQTKTIKLSQTEKNIVYKEKSIQKTPKRPTVVKSEPKQALSPRQRILRQSKGSSPNQRSSKININMEIKNLNIYGKELKNGKKLHKKTISYLPHYKQQICKVQPRLPRKIDKHFKAKSQENLKINPFQLETILGKTSSNFKGVISKYGFCNRGGKSSQKKNKINQDSYIAFENFMTKSSYLFGVCDGHGINGHYVSQFIKEILPQNIQYFFLKSKNLHKTSKGTVSTNLKEAFAKTSKNLTQSGIDVMFSGSTTCIVFINRNQLYCANLGDSRAVIYSKSDKWSCKELSYDHKADDEREAYRITINGGRVFPYRDENGQQLGPYRVWLKDQNIPGLAMTRSFGDYIASTVGVISEPEVIHHEINKDDKFLVIASDGLWQFITNEQVMKIVEPAFVRNDVQQAVKLLQMVAVEAWQRQDQNIDDITIVVIFFKYY